MHLKIIILTILFITYSIILHEIAHGLMAFIMGDRTAVKQGRITLNPLKHIDLVGTIILPLALYLMSKYIGAQIPIFGWAKPVPVNPNNFRYRKFGMALVGIAGPAINLIFMLISGVLLTHHKFFLMLSGWKEPLTTLFVINYVLFIFNLLPIPPLDGSRIVSWLLPDKLASKYDKLGRYGFVALILLMQTPVLQKVYEFGLKYVLKFLKNVDGI